MGTLTYLEAAAPRRYVDARGHRRTASSPLERFFSNVEDLDGCWVWTKALTADGYAPFWLTSTALVRAHRWIYELLVAEIPDGLVLDHLCRVRHCVNPWHLEVVTFGENTRRGLAAVTSWCAGKTHCHQGHAFDKANTYVHPVTGHRTCRRCRADRMRRYAA